MLILTLKAILQVLEKPGKTSVECAQIMLKSVIESLEQQPQKPTPQQRTTGGVVLSDPAASARDELLGRDGHSVEVDDPAGQGDAS
jgi:hypothetical protein